MSDSERTGERDLTYSQWHRKDSIRRYLGHYEAWVCGLIDVDGCEYCRHCGEPLALIETQVSDRDPKAAPVMARLASMARIPAYSVSIVFGDQEEIAFFRVQRLAPTRDAVKVMLPHEYARWLYEMREQHPCLRVVRRALASDQPAR